MRPRRQSAAWPRGDAYANEADNRLEQDLLMIPNGMRPGVLLRRWQRYTTYVNDPALQNDPFVLKYKHQVNAARATPIGPAEYVSGASISGQALRVFSNTPTLCGPLVCQLCDDSFLCEESFLQHQKKDHGGVNEYRKRTLYLMQQAGCRPITGQEKRIMVQNFAHFQQFSRLVAKGNRFVQTPEVQRCEVACALCLQRDFFEHRHKLALFGTPPQTAVDAKQDVPAACR